VSQSMPSMPDPRDIRSFEDLAKVPDEIFRQIASRVHVIDLAYAFRDAGELKDRLLNAVRPELAEQIRGSLRAVDWQSERVPPDDQQRAARARVMEVVKLELGLA
jgi:hypothetical protein